MAIEPQKVVDFLLSQATRSLRANIVDVNGRQYLRAGAHQFNSLWTRDFAYAVPGLLAIGEEQVVETHLSELLRSVSGEGLVPRILEQKSSKWTVLKWTLFRRFQFHTMESHSWKPYALRAEYFGEHGTRALDSGLLTLLASLQVSRHLAKAPHQKSKSDFLSIHFQDIVRVLRFYERETQKFTELLSQNAFEDWQDSAKRVGPLSYCNLLLLWVLLELPEALLRELKIDLGQIQEFAQKIVVGFPLTSESLIPIFAGKSESSVMQASLETQLHALEIIERHSTRLAGALAPWQELWPALKRSSLFKDNIGVPVAPFYPSDQISFFAKAVGLRHYHDGFRWTWLMAEVARRALRNGDGELMTQLLEQLRQSIELAGGVCEILERESLHPVRRFFYHSEVPFSWGAGRIALLCQELNQI